MAKTSTSNAEALYELLSDNTGSLRAQIKATQEYGTAPGLAILHSLVTFVKDAPDQMAAGQVRASLESVRGHKAETAELAARYVATHASTAALAAARALGGRSDLALNRIRSRVISACGGL